MMGCYDLPIMRKITSQKSLSPCQRERLKGLKERFKKEGIIPSKASLQEVRYLLRLEAGRKRYRWRKIPSISQRKEWEEAMKNACPSLNLTIEEILAEMSRKNVEQDRGSEE